MQDKPPSRASTLPGSHYFQNLSSGCPELTPQLIREIAAVYREVFSNDWPEFAACFSCESQLQQKVKFSASEIVCSAESYIPLPELDRIKVLPPCPHCGQRMEFFIDLGTVVKKFSAKFSKDAFITLIRNREKRYISGVTFASSCSLREAFEQEEWKHPYAYSARRDPRYERSFDDFLQIIAPEFERLSVQSISPDRDILLWNCVAIRPDLRFQGYLSRMVNSLYCMIPEDSSDLPVMGQSEKNSKFYYILRTAGFREIEGFLPEGQVFMCGYLGSVVLSLRKQASGTA